MMSWDQPICKYSVSTLMIGLKRMALLWLRSSISGRCLGIDLVKSNAHHAIALTSLIGSLERKKPHLYSVLYLFPIPKASQKWLGNTLVGILDRLRPAMQ